MTAVLERPTRTDPPDDGNHERFIAIHSARPEMDRWYYNDLLHGPRRTPWTWANDGIGLVVVTWLSWWEAERCVARMPLSPPATLKAGDTLHMTWSSVGMAGWERVPIPGL